MAGAALGDLNRDGRLDLLVGHHFGSAAETGPGVPIRVYMNRGLDGSGDPIFEDITDDIGLPPIDSKAPHVDIQDFDNDGWPDLYVSVTVDSAAGAVPLIFRHDGLLGDDPRFEIPSAANPHYYPAGPAADFDRDGRLDLFLGEFRSVYQGTPQDQGVVRSVLIRNTSPSGNWLDVHVDGPTAGIGVKVSVYQSGRADDPAGLLGYRELVCGYGFSSGSPPLAHFGLGSETVVDVVVAFPRVSETVTLTGVPANQLLVVPR